MLYNAHSVGTFLALAINPFACRRDRTFFSRIQTNAEDSSFSMLKILKSILRSTRSVDAQNLAPEKLFKACREILQVNGLNMHPSFGFKLSVSQSKLPNAGYGIIVADGRVNKGDVVCLYSGTYFPPPPVWALASVDGEPIVKPFQISKIIPTTINEEQATLAAAYRIHCNMEGGHIDGIEYTPYAENKVAAGKEKPEVEVSRLCMPYSSGQLINHPAPGMLPNVHLYDFNWTQYFEYLKVHEPAVDLNEERKRIEKINTLGEGPWYFDPAAGKVVPLSENCTSCVGLATIASRDIEAGEEIYLDYKYHKDDQPPWYTPVTYNQ